MIQAKPGDQVKVHYTGRLTDGTVFDSSRGSEPIAFEVGAGMMIPGFDAGVQGMSVGETRTVDIPHTEAYGPYHAEALVKVPREQFPPELTPELGVVLRMTHPTGVPIDMTIVELGETEVTLDGNHPLAGKDLQFDLELVSID